MNERGKGGMDERWHAGIWLGAIQTPDETIVGTPEGVVKARSVRRKPLADRWSKSELGGMKGSPWKPIPTADGDNIRTSVNVGQEIDLDTEDPRGKAKEESEARRERTASRERVEHKQKAKRKRAERERKKRTE